MANASAQPPRARNARLQQAPQARSVQGQQPAAEVSVARPQSKRAPPAAGSWTEVVSGKRRRQRPQVKAAVVPPADGKEEDSAMEGQLDSALEDTICSQTIVCPDPSEVLKVLACKGSSVLALGAHPAKALAPLKPLQRSMLA